MRVVGRKGGREGSQFLGERRASTPGRQHAAAAALSRTAEQIHSGGSEEVVEVEGGDSEEVRERTPPQVDTLTFRISFKVPGLNCATATPSTLTSTSMTFPWKWFSIHLRSRPLLLDGFMPAPVRRAKSSMLTTPTTLLSLVWGEREQHSLPTLPTGRCAMRPHHQVVRGHTHVLLGPLPAAHSPRGPLWPESCALQSQLYPERDTD